MTPLCGPQPIISFGSRRPVPKRRIGEGFQMLLDVPDGNPKLLRIPRPLPPTSIVPLAGALDAHILNSDLPDDQWSTTAAYGASFFAPDTLTESLSRLYLNFEPYAGQGTEQPGGALTRRTEDTAELAWVEFSTVVEGERGRYKQRSKNAVAYGGFSDVFLCDARLANGSSTLVAVKRLRAVKITGHPDSCTIDQKLQKRLDREVKIWMNLQHTNIAPLLGFVLEGEVCIITPWFENGNVAAYIGAHPHVDRIKLVQHVAEGVAYLHNRDPVIVHGDIKPDNILIDQDGIPKLIDFGLSKAIETDPELVALTSASLRDAGNARWVAPELIFGEAVSRSCSTDSFSFGCVGFFIFTGDVPFKGIPDTGLVIMRYKGAEPVCADYPDLDSQAHMKNALWRCLEKDSNSRPTMSTVVQLLKQTTPP